MKLSGDQIHRLMVLIRCPVPGMFFFEGNIHYDYTQIMKIGTPTGELVIQDIIPAIARLRTMYDIKFSTMFSSALLERVKNPNQLHFTSSDLRASDLFFDSISME